MAFRATDRSARHALHVRRGVAAFVVDPARHAREPDLEVATDYDSWLRFFVCRQELDPFLSAAAIECGSKDEVRAFFELFDRYAEGTNNMLRPAEQAR